MEERDWEEEPGSRFRTPGHSDGNIIAEDGPGVNNRLETLMPRDPQTGVVTGAALRTYLSAMADMMARHGLPLSVICVAVDDGPALRSFGQEGSLLIAHAVVRQLRQETRVHDVIGRTAEAITWDLPAFVVVCPLVDETGAAQLAERMRVAMTAQASESGRAWLTLSVGVAALTLDIVNPETIVTRAIRALYHARRAGGGSVWRHSATGR